MKQKDVFRIIDANFNRFREAMRVCEDVARFAVEDKASTAKLKRIRHEALRALAGTKEIKYAFLVASRDSGKDIGKYTIPQELKRRGPTDILNANLQRAKESARVLEEFFKVIDRQAALKFKKIRFRIYDIEKRLYER